MNQKTRRKGKRTLLGLNNKHRVVFSDPYNRICIVLANLGFSIDTISEHTGLTRSQVIYRCHKKGLSVLDYRNGKSAKATSLLNQYDTALKKRTG